MLDKNVEGAAADTADDDHFNPQLTEPARKRSRLMLRRRQSFSAQGGFGVGVHFNDRKLAAAAEMRIQATVLNRNSNFHNFVICPLN